MVATLSGSSLSSPAHHGGGLHETRLAGSRHKAQGKVTTCRCDVGFRTLGFNCCRNMRNRLQPISVAANRLFVVTGLVWRGLKRNGSNEKENPEEPIKLFRSARPPTD